MGQSILHYAWSLEILAELIRYYGMLTNIPALFLSHGAEWQLPNTRIVTADERDYGQSSWNYKNLGEGGILGGAGEVGLKEVL